MRLGIFGGTFDPPHLGHLILASEAAAQLELDKVLWVLTPHPPHKQGKTIASIDHRLAMLHAAIIDDTQFQLSTVDIDRPPPHYALDTVRLLHQAHLDAGLFYLMGSDSLVELPTWHKPLEFVHACDGIGVMHRAGETADMVALERILPGLTARVKQVSAPLVEISSSDIRSRIAAGRAYRYHVPPAVFNYIVAHQLYQSS